MDIVLLEYQLKWTYFPVLQRVFTLGMGNNFFHNSNRLRPPIHNKNNLRPPIHCSSFSLYEQFTRPFHEFLFHCSANFSSRVLPMTKKWNLFLSYFKIIPTTSKTNFVTILNENWNVLLYWVKILSFHVALGVLLDIWKFNLFQLDLKNKIKCVKHDIFLIFQETILSWKHLKISICAQGSTIKAHWF